MKLSLQQQALDVHPSICRCTFAFSKLWGQITLTPAQHDAVKLQAHLFFFFICLQGLESLSHKGTAFSLD